MHFPSITRGRRGDVIVRTYQMDTPPLVRLYTAVGARVRVVSVHPASPPPFVCCLMSLAGWLVLYMYISTREQRSQVFEPQVFECSIGFQNQPAYEAAGGDRGSSAGVAILARRRRRGAVTDRLSFSQSSRGGVDERKGWADGIRR